MAEAGRGCSGLVPVGRHLRTHNGAYTYTPRGTINSLDDGVVTTTYVFDGPSRMTSSSDGTTTVVYGYDGLDRIATRNSDTFVYQGTSLDPVSDRTFTWARSPGGRVLSQSDGVSDLLAGVDRHGDLTFLFSAAGVVSDTALFDPFGDPLATTGTSGSTLGFQSDYTDPVSDHVWMGARWYDGGWAAFLSRDSVFGELSTPVSLNRYTYGFANPLSFWDPDGRMPVRIGVAVVGGSAPSGGGSAPLSVAEVRARYASIDSVNRLAQQASQLVAELVSQTPVRSNQRSSLAPPGWAAMSNEDKLAWVREGIPELQNPATGFGTTLGDIGGAFVGAVQDKIVDPLILEPALALSEGRFLDAVNAYNAVSPFVDRMGNESPWKSWRLLSLETRMELWQVNGNQLGLRRAAIRMRTRRRRCGWCDSSEARPVSGMGR